MSKKSYPQVKAGDWVRPIRRGYKLQCCDCGLVHTMNFRVVKGRIEFQPFRDNRATAQVRRWKKKRKEVDPLLTKYLMEKFVPSLEKGLLFTKYAKARKPRSKDRKVIRFARPA